MAAKIAQMNKQAHVPTLMYAVAAAVALIVIYHAASGGKHRSHRR